MRYLPIMLLTLCLLALGPALAEGPSDDEGDQVMTIDREWSVTVDGQTRTWAAFERGTEIAWQAFLDGDFRNAVPVFSRLAEMGHPVGEWLMGIVYYRGQGVPMDKGLSFAWFLKAAEQGYFRAFAPLAGMYENGEGTAVDTGLAYAWYNIAISRLPESRERNDLIRLRERVAANMTNPQIESAQKRANNFVPNPIIPPDPEDVQTAQPE